MGVRKMEWAGKASHLGGIPRKTVIICVGSFAKAVAMFLNSTCVQNQDTLLNLVRSRPVGVPLITVNNHMSTSEIFYEKSFDEWVDLAEAPALPANLRLYTELQQLGFKIFLLTGRSEFQRN